MTVCVILVPVALRSFPFFFSDFGEIIKTLNRSVSELESSTDQRFHKKSV